MTTKLGLLGIPTSDGGDSNVNIRVPIGALNLVKQSITIDTQPYVEVATTSFYVHLEDVKISSGVSVKTPTGIYQMNAPRPSVSTGVSILYTPVGAFNMAKYEPSVFTAAHIDVPSTTIYLEAQTLTAGINYNVRLEEFSFSLISNSPTVVTGAGTRLDVKNIALSPLPIQISSGVNIRPATVYRVIRSPLTGVSTGGSVDTQFREFRLHKNAIKVSSGANISVDVTEFNIITSTPKVAISYTATVPLAYFNIEGLDLEYVGNRPVYSLDIPITRFEIEGIGPTIYTPIYIDVPTTTFNAHHGVGYYKVQLVKCNGAPVPLEHVEDSKKLDADAYVELFEITLSDNSTKICLKLNHTVTWQGNRYEGTGIKIEGVASYADDEVSRPKLTLFNPEGIYSYLIDGGYLDNAKVIRYRVLKTHIDQDLPIFRSQQWRVNRVASLTKNYVALELRDMLDGQHFLTPGRMFIPPEFPMVSLT